MSLLIYLVHQILVFNIFINNNVTINKIKGANPDTTISQFIRHNFEIKSRSK